MNFTRAPPDRHAVKPARWLTCTSPTFIYFLGNEISLYGNST